MDIEALLKDSLAYTQDALVGKWTRWAIFVILALPLSLIRFTFDPKTIMTGTSINWDAIPWGRIALLAGLGYILSFFISGYMVRIYRGQNPPPTSPDGLTFLSMVSSSLSSGSCGSCLSSLSL